MATGQPAPPTTVKIIKMIKFISEFVIIFA